MTSMATKGGDGGDYLSRWGSVGWSMDVRMLLHFPRSLGDDKLTSQDFGLRKALGRVTSHTWSYLILMMSRLYDVV